MEELARFSKETWFRLGDKDLALHIERTRRLAAGEPLEFITQDFGSRLGVATQVLTVSAPSSTRRRVRFPSRNTSCGVSALPP